LLSELKYYFKARHQVESLSVRSDLNLYAYLLFVFLFQLIFCFDPVNKESNQPKASLFVLGKGDLDDLRVDVFDNLDLYCFWEQFL